jgi:hypothetical protein
VAQFKKLVDEYGIIYHAYHSLPNDQLKLEFLEALAELANEECHRTRTFPKTRLHRVVGIKQKIYRADVNKISGWRIHLQYIDGELHLKDLIPGSQHDNVHRIIKSKKGRYE